MKQEDRATAPSPGVGRKTTFARTGQPLRHQLEARLRSFFADEALGLDGRLRNFRDNLVDGVDPAALPPRRGLDEQLRRVEGAAGLIVNSFLPWTERPGKLQLAGCSGFDELRLLIRCPTGVRGTPPTIPALARGPRVVVGIEACALDYLSAPRRQLAAAYRDMVTEPGLEPWHRAVEEAIAPGRVRHLPVAHLFKLSLALARNFPGAECRLLYLFLEPAGSEGMGPFACHREELAWLAGLTSDSAVGFVFSSFGELWEAWRSAAPTPSLRQLATRLLARYCAPLTPRRRPVLVRPDGP